MPVRLIVLLSRFTRVADVVDIVNSGGIGCQNHDEGLPRPVLYA